MTGQDLKDRIKEKGITLAYVAEQLGTSPQNLGAKLSTKSVKMDFLARVEAIIDRCCPPLPAEMQAAVIGSNINGSHSPNVQQTTGSSTALSRENELLRQQNEFLRQQVDRLMALLEKK